MNKVKSIDVPTTIAILDELEKLSKVIETTRRKIIMALPANYGSNLWWEQGHIEAQEDIKAGRVYELRSVNDLDEYSQKLSSK